MSKFSITRCLAKGLVSALFKET
uniref:Uncharacterized protein n=1 Tax=Rhizophora mucronata TaxID=61149 RepID=A0A2P2PLC2_RHIMU